MARNGKELKRSLFGSLLTGSIGGVAAACMDHILAKRRHGETRRHAAEILRANHRLHFLRFLMAWKLELTTEHRTNVAHNYSGNVARLFAEVMAVRNDFAEATRAEFDKLVLALSSLTTEQINEPNKSPGRVIAEPLDALLGFVEQIESTLDNIRDSKSGSFLPGLPPAGPDDPEQSVAWNRGETSLSVPPEPTETRLKGPSPFRTLWAFALGVSVLVSVYAVFRGGYVGGDYNVHVARILASTRFLDFSLADPPIYVVLGHGLLKLIGPNNGFLYTYSIIQVAINTVAVWWFFLYSEARFKSSVLHLAFVFFVTFLAVRMIHAVSIGTDWMTIPVFVLVLYLFEKFLSEKTSTPRNAAVLGLALALGIWSKYNFMALLPAFFIIFAFLARKRRWKLKRFVTICALSLVLPSGLLLYSYWESTRVKDATAKAIWIPKGGARSQPETNWKDLFSVKAADLRLFSAPEFYRKKASDPYPWGYREAHRHSFLALVHLGTFTDTQNGFQDLRVPRGVGNFLIPDMKTRRAWKTPVMAASMTLGVLWTVLALIGTPWFLVGAVKRLWQDKLAREDVALLLGTPFFLLMFLLIPFLMWSALTASWQPRLYLVPLLCFFWAGFLLLDRVSGAKREKIASVVLALVIVQSGIEIVMLI